jgi:hypothetical protein
LEKLGAETAIEKGPEELPRKAAALGTREHELEQHLAEKKTSRKSAGWRTRINQKQALERQESEMRQLQAWEEEQGGSNRTRVGTAPGAGAVQREVVATAPKVVPTSAESVRGVPDAYKDLLQDYFDTVATYAHEAPSTDSGTPLQQQGPTSMEQNDDTEGTHTVKLGCAPVVMLVRGCGANPVHSHRQRLGVRSVLLRLRRGS